jgi:shikimate dehydrogenase
MRKFGLIGFPLGHSFSKIYFEDKFLTESIRDCSYDNFEIENLGSVKALISNDNELVGLNVTIPFKTEIIRYLDQIDDEASEIGAVNVLKISERGNRRIVKGFNTDIFGFRESLIPYLSGKKVNSALILGTGGSSKAVAFVLCKLGIEMKYVSRMSSEETISYDELTDELLLKNQLIINTTPLGMFPDTKSAPELNYSCLTSNHILYDLVYNPVMTSFLRKGYEHGCTIIGGIEMLRLQAEKSWEIWNSDT